MLWNIAICFTIIIGSSLGSSVQFCRVNKQQGTDLCLAIATYHNHTTEANDFYLHISSKFKDRLGYSAFGTGPSMDGALMFVLYPSKISGGITTSLRTTNLHYPPQNSDIVPDYRVLKKEVKEEYHNVDIVCYGCDEWTRNKASVTSDSQPWIFANHYSLLIQSDNERFPLALHTDYDQFFLDMTAAHHEQTKPAPAIFLENGRKSSSSGSEQTRKWTKLELYKLHGLLLTIAFGITMPLSITIIRSGVRWAFIGHWSTQIFSTLLCFIGMWLAVKLSWSTFEYGNLKGFHQMIGIFIFITLCIQPLLGYWHHVRYLKIRRRTSVSTFHRYLGATIIVVGWINASLGIYIAGCGLTLEIVWAIFIVLGAIMMMKAETIQHLIIQTEGVKYQPLNRS